MGDLGMGREISLLDFSAETRRETPSRPVSSRFHLVSVCIELLSFECSKSRTCLDVYFTMDGLKSSVSFCLEISRPVSSRQNTVSTHQAKTAKFKICPFETP